MILTNNGARGASAPPLAGPAPHLFQAVLRFLLVIVFLTGLATLGGAGQEDGTAKKININTATKEELEALPGIGPVMAGRIVRHRKISGAFRTVEELVVIRGISRRLFEKQLRGRVTVGKERAPARKKNGSGK